MARHEAKALGRVDRITKQLRLSDAEKRRFSAYLAPLAGKVVELVVREFRPRVTSKQHGYYRGVVLPVVAEHLGYTEKEAHAALGREFLVINPDARLPRVRSTGDLTDGEMAHFIDRVIQLAAEQGCMVPPPDPNYQFR